uniref:Metalloproteinase inhibitor 3-like n=1 Tax=Crassostrea virginica TaxID=6565 RepID=A0A8B8ALV2_CRAVI|nr:metalloproteinase inhibitor 3-like [Crassostrea virginica]
MIFNCPMLFIFQVIFSLLVIIMAYISGIDACSCFKRDPQSLYCDSAFVVIGEVTGERFEIVPNDYNGHVRIVYDVDVTKVYKGKLSKGSIEIRTEESDGVCGVTLEVNKVYLLNGNLHQNETLIDSCGTMRFSPINNPESMIPLDTYYDCRCKVLNVNLDSTITKNTCVPEPRTTCPPDSGALEGLSVCRYNQEMDRCTWQC